MPWSRARPRSRSESPWSRQASSPAHGCGGGSAMGAPDRIERVRAAAYRIATDAPEADGTFEWDSTTMVVAEVFGCGKTGIGYTYATSAAAVVIVEDLAKHVLGGDVFSPRAAWDAMQRAVRNN